MKKMGRNVAPFSKKALAALLSGALAVSMVPAAAFATALSSWDQGTDPGLQMANTKFTYTDSDGNEQTTITWADGDFDTDATTVNEDGSTTYVYRTTVPGDVNHYATYDAKISMTVKDNVLTAISFDSDGTTWGGRWGQLGAKTGYTTGYLPTGVTNTTTVSTDADGNTVISKIGLDGTKQYDTKGNGGYAISSISIYSADSNGTVNEYVLDENGDIVYDLVLDESDGDYDPVARKNAVTVSTSLDSSDSDYVTCDAEAGTITIAAGSGFNLMKVYYTIGEGYRFYQYTACDENAAKYDVEITDLTAFDATGIASKNRNQFSLVAFMEVCQQLGLFMDGEIDDLDTITGATKSSEAVVEAIYAAQGYYYPLSNKAEYVSSAVAKSEWAQLFTSVADDLYIELDGEDATVYTAAVATGDVTVVQESSSSMGAGIAGISLYSYDTALTAAEQYKLGVASDSEGTSVYMDQSANANCVAMVASTASVSNGYAAALDSTSIYDTEGNLVAYWNADVNQLYVYDSSINYVSLNYVMCKKSSGKYLGTMGIVTDLTAATSVSALEDEIADLQGQLEDAAAAIAAAGEAVKSLVSQELSVKAKASVKAGKTVKIAVKGAKGKLVASCAKSGVKVSVKGSKIVVKAKKKGTYKVKVYAKATSKCAKSVTKTITVKVK